MKLNEILTKLTIAMDARNIDIYGDERNRAIGQAHSAIFKWIEKQFPKIEGYSPEVTEILKRYRKQIFENLGIK